MTELTSALQDAGWTLSDDGKSIAKTYRFATFAEAMGWMVKAGFTAEAMDHHPDWTNVYNRVEVKLTSHDVGGLSDRDIRLAEAMEAL